MMTFDDDKMHHGAMMETDECEKWEENHQFF